MKKLIYSPESIQKIEKIREYLKEEFGPKIAKEKEKNLKSRITSLKRFPNQGISLHDFYGFKTDYRQLYVPPNYVIYRIIDDKIIIFNLYYDREDYIEKLFY